MNVMPADRCDLLCLDLPKAERIRGALPAVDALTATADLMKALSDPTRVQVAAALAQTDELCVCDLAWITGVPRTSSPITCARSRPRGSRPRAARARWRSTRSRRPGRALLALTEQVGV